MSHLIDTYWPYIATTFAIIATLLAAVQIILTKRDVNAAIGWLGLVIVAPVFGPILYLLFGVNRIQRVAKKQRPQSVALPFFQPMVEGNTIVPLTPSTEAFQTMLASINGARSTISLCEYIFDNDEVGRQFLDALVNAKNRGVAVRILIDAVGARYSFPRMVPLLKRSGLHTELFMSSLLPWRFRYFNLRNHRKILVIDGRIGFTGGMNIRSDRVIEDIHFQVEGPVVAHLQEAFAHDWLFSTGEALTGSDWFPAIEARGTVPARGIPDGPDADFENLKWAYMNVIAGARESITIATPYFLPDTSLVAFLSVASLRGVRVTVILPRHNNLPFVHWAMMAHAQPLLEHGVRIHLTEPNFDHSKIMVVDESTVMLGSANWDARSLRLNFEFNLECVDRALARSLTDLLQTKLTKSREITLDQISRRPIWVRLRDSSARLLSPYL
ncbi:MAG: PLDc N-terminal domain-containing protein [Deltaproteobacteria bacterium]|nr:PLDc N-terminal domain-containing protein [Deltaproteobacteria bacterium]MBI3296484.1 PLDc N-terminal domain-containing protein [Deltaproteobacteria bacterium]